MGRSDNNSRGGRGGSGRGRGGRGGGRGKGRGGPHKGKQTSQSHRKRKSAFVLFYHMNSKSFV